MGGRGGGGLFEFKNRSNYLGPIQTVSRASSATEKHTSQVLHLNPPYINYMHYP